MSTVYDPPAGKFMKLHADLQQDLSCVSNRKEASMTKTPEQIVLDALGNEPTQQAFRLYLDIKAYGDQRVAEMRCQVDQLVARVVALEKAASPDLTIPPKPTTLERVAMAMANGGAAYDGWGGYTDATKAHYRTAARAGVEALKTSEAFVAGDTGNGGGWRMPAHLVNAYLDSILAEKQP